jgi:hypothetical protein
MRATAIPGASSYGAPRQAIGGDAPMADEQAPTTLPNRTSGGGGGGGFLRRASGGDPGG